MSVEYIKFSDPYLVIKKKSEFKEILKVKWVHRHGKAGLKTNNLSPEYSSLIKAMEIGIQHRTMSRIYTKKPLCVNRQNFQSISIDDAFPALLVVPFGILFAFIVLVTEKVLSVLKFNRRLCLKI